MFSKKNKISSTSIKTKIRIGFLFFLIMLVSRSAGNYYSFINIQDSVNYENTTLNEEKILSEGLTNEILQADNLLLTHILATSFVDMDSKEAKIAEINSITINNLNKLKTIIEKDMHLNNSDIIDELTKNVSLHFDLIRQNISLSRLFTSDSPIIFLYQARDFFNNNITSQAKIIADLRDKIDSDIEVKIHKSEKDLENFSKAFLRKLLSTGIFATLLGLLFLYLFEKKLINILLEITHLMKEISNGKLELKIHYQDRNDEVGEMAKALEVFRYNAEEKIKLEKEQDQMIKISQKEKEESKIALTKEFENNVQNIINLVSSASNNLFKTAEKMQNSVETVSRETNTVASSSSITSKNVVEVAGNVEEMSQSIQEVSSQVTKTSELVSGTLNKTNQANQSMELLSSAVSEITSILELIDDIAKKINLLSLNATIESARAGEAGKGFAVVSSEVKALAKQTAKATNTIAEQIINIKHVSGTVAEALNNIQEMMKDLNLFSVGISSAVEEQSIATSNIASNMNEASLQVQNISSGVSVISQHSQDATTEAKEVFSASKILMKQSEMLNNQVSIFLGAIKKL